MVMSTISYPSILQTLSYALHQCHAQGVSGSNNTAIIAKAKDQVNSDIPGYVRN
jgi:hypothetical protein